MIGSLMLIVALNTTIPIDLSGTAGLCIRWDGPEHISDAIVVVSSGNPALDEAVPSLIRARRWQRPDPYNHGWVGIAFTAQSKPLDMAPPDCSRYRLPELPHR
jgi:uncharacterized NAD(P)/FAD-binding protein YdhS